MAGLPAEGSQSCKRTGCCVEMQDIVQLAQCRCELGGCAAPPFFLPHSTCRLPMRLPPLQGVDCGEITLLLHVRPCEGLVRQVSLPAVKGAHLCIA